MFAMFFAPVCVYNFMLVSHSAVMDIIMHECVYVYINLCMVALLSSLVLFRCAWSCIVFAIDLLNLPPSVYQSF